MERKLRNVDALDPSESSDVLELPSDPEENKLPDELSEE